MNIALCDDDPKIIEDMTKLITSWAMLHEFRDISTESFSSAEGLLLSIEDTAGFDAYFLDLELPKMHGFELAQEIRKIDSKVPIVFVTNSDDYLLRGYELELCRYLKKPLYQDTFYSALDKCREKYDVSQDTSFVIRLNGTSIRLDQRDIVYIMSEGHTAVYVLHQDSPVRQPIRSNFEQFSRELPETFLRCHKSFIVNLLHVYSYHSTQIRMTNGEEIPIGKAYREQAVRTLQEWFLNHLLI